MATNGQSVPINVNEETLRQNVEFSRIEGNALGTIGRFSKETSIEGEGSLANRIVPNDTKQGAINVVGDYRWTLSKLSNISEIPYVRLIEYRCNESTIKKQFDFYTKLTPTLGGNALGIDAKKSGVLEVYKEIFPKDEPTDYSYWLPYFNQSGFELNSSNWTQLDSAAESLKNLAEGTKNILGGAEKLSKKMNMPFLSKGLSLAQDVIGIGQGIAQAGATAAQTSMMFQYPTVGTTDRPKVFAGHSERTFTVTFPLFNIVDEQDWIKNRDLIYLLMSQNHFNKRDLTTGVPPVFYDIYVPGQYYCYAACVTNISVKNSGNMRLLYNEYIVPDAYEVTLTFNEMVSPSKNQFEAVINGSARKFVSTETLIRNQPVQSQTAPTITTPTGTAISVGRVTGIPTNEQLYNSSTAS